MTENSLYVFLHIPRTGGTAFEYNIGHFLNRENSSYKYHYNCNDISNIDIYYQHNIPTLSNRTSTQQKEIKVLTGHSTFVNSHKWFRIYKIPYFFTFIRNPIERLLSSFNYRYQATILTQDNSMFSLMQPILNNNAIINKKTAEDYNTLYEYYLDADVEHNIQSKWLIKSYFTKTQHGWQHHPTYNGTISGLGTSPFGNVPVTIPEWMWEDDSNSFDDLLSYVKEKLWWVSTTEQLTQSAIDFCQYLNIDYYENTLESINSSTQYVKPKWSIEDVMNQPDINKIIQNEKYDIELYNFAKQFKRPF